MEKQLRSLSELQLELDQYIGQFKTGYFSPLSQMVQLTEEVGELAKEINHEYGEKTKKEKEATSSVQEEIGDVLITILIMANALEIDLDQAMEENMKKFRERDFYRFERKDGKTND